MDIRQKLFYENLRDAVLNWVAMLLILWADVILLYLKKILWPLVMPFAVFVIGWAVQITCWFAFGVMGVSLVWCTSLGCALYIAVKSLPTKIEKKRAIVVISIIQTASIGYGLALVVYYLIENPLLTTVAHICGILLGAITMIFFPFQYKDKEKYMNISGTTGVLHPLDDEEDFK